MNRISTTTFDCRHDPLSAEAMFEAAETLHTHGVVVIQNALRGNDLNNVNKELASLSRIVPNGDPHSPRRAIPPVWLAAHGHGQAVRHVAQTFNNSCIRDLADSYYQEPWSLYDILSIESVPSEAPIIGWHADCMSPDLFLNDPAYRRIKFHIYLNDVRTENGAFAYIPGSHRCLQELKQKMGSGMLPVAHLSDFDKVIEYIEVNKSNLSTDTIAMAAWTKESIMSSTSWVPNFEIEGTPGTIIVFDETGLHAANSVRFGHRSVLRLGLMDNKRFRQSTSFMTRFKRACLKKLTPIAAAQLV